ncbi:MAG TPA: histidine kinase dimerization/phospho-acceptor domain-containing protein, partial [Mobilitalea sp.]|nr:histidine kinase dimerization/phospho-acceptor domain-containing protein [Mobilitalea sp.]
MKLYTDMMMDNSLDQMQERAKVISDTATDCIKKDKASDYLSNLSSIEVVNGWDIYTVSDPHAAYPMSSDMENSSTFEDFQASPEMALYVEILESAFQGKEVRKDKYYDQTEERNSLAVACPIYGFNDEVVGAVLVKQPFEGQPEIVTKSLSTIVLSSVVALGISFIIVILFATELSLPISRMRATALELAAGNYKIKTGISRDDEIGDLAKTVDILSEKLLENDIERKKLDQMRLDFFANVSHELRTPITVIRAYTETLADGVVKDADKVEQYYGRMLSECKSMERLVGDLLTLSKMQNPDFAIEKEPVNLQQVFDDIMRSAGAIAQRKNITIEVTKDSPVSMILGDYDRLRQMFMVILDNAIKFSDENKSVHIKLTKSDKIKVSIKDFGVGIEPCDIGNIFEKFYKSNLRQNAS